MNRNIRLAALAVLMPMIAVSCGGNDSPDVAPPPPPAPAPPVPAPPSVPTDAQRSAAAAATAATNPKCSVATLGPYYWEIGDVNGVRVSNSEGSGAPTVNTVMWVFSSSKWLYAANVVQKRGVVGTDVPFLNFTSGYSQYGNAPICLPGNGSDTVQGCVPLGGNGNLDAATVGKFAYDSGHMQHHATAVMGLGPADNAALAADLNATIGNFGFTYSVPQLAAGVNVSPAGYAMFLRKMLNGGLALASALGTNKKCANNAIPGCDAAFTPEELPTTEAWNYSLGHWVEDDPTVGDHAFSSAGGGGFYPWIDSSKTYYGIVARERETEAGAGIHSEECGRLIRQAWKTGVTVSSTTPTP